MAQRRALVGNASDRQQIKRAASFERRRAEQLRSDLAMILSFDAGVRVFVTLLDRWSAWTSVFETDPIRMAHRAGKQDVAHELMLLASDADETAIVRIMAEHERQQRELQKFAGAKTETDDDDDVQEPLTELEEHDAS